MVVEAQGFGSPPKNGSHFVTKNEGGGTSPLLRNIAFCLTTCGLVAFFVGLFKQLGATKTRFGKLMDDMDATDGDSVLLCLFWWITTGICSTKST